MEKNGIGMLSCEHTTSSFREMNLSIDSSSEDWNIAIGLFEQRFEERYFKSIEKMLEEPEKNGFAIMALNCLLVDTFYQFENGLDEANNNQRCYTRFLRTYMREIISSSGMAERFYKDIRCGILHSAQTKNGSRLTVEGTATVEFMNEQGSIRVDVVKFSNELKKYFQEYTMRLKNGDERTRLRFVTKMNFIGS